MTVNELIEVLERHRASGRGGQQVVTDGYEDGYEIVLAAHAFKDLLEKTDPMWWEGVLGRGGDTKAIYLQTTRKGKVQQWP